MKNYLVIYERGEKHWGAFSPDVPGCIATGRTKAEVKKRMRSAIAFHLQGLRQKGLPIPEGSCAAETISIAV